MHIENAPALPGRFSFGGRETDVPQRSAPRRRGARRIECGGLAAFAAILARASVRLGRPMLRLGALLGADFRAD
ncbi:MAG TPA: hypothetical protein VN153_13145, partial [Tahibacter sp.]|nr:hypothetical protein [Tahibacter sp.]